MKSGASRSRFWARWSAWVSAETVTDAARDSNTAAQTLAAISVRPYSKFARSHTDKIRRKPPGGGGQLDTSARGKNASHDERLAVASRRLARLRILTGVRLIGQEELRDWRPGMAIGGLPTSRIQRFGKSYNLSDWRLRG